MTLDFLLKVVPVLLALVFGGALVFLLVDNSSESDYQVPEILTNVMTSILGYYFGLRATTAASKGTSLTVAELQRMMNSGGAAG